MPAGWLQKYFNTIRTPNTFEKRNVIRYNLRIFDTEYFQPNIARKIRIFSLGRKNNICILVKKKSVYDWIYENGTADEKSFL